MDEKFSEFLASAKDDELWVFYGEVESELKRRNQLRTRNIIAERAETIAIEYYNSTPNLPKLQLAPPGTKFIDAISREGERFAIKGARLKTSSSSTFQSDDFSEKHFEHLILVRIDEKYQPFEIYQASWDVVNNNKYFDKTMNAYNLPLRKKLFDEAKLIFSQDK